MKIRVMLAFFAIGLGTAVAGDPPGYARALIGHVVNIVPEGLVVQGVNLNQIHPGVGPGVDHECFAGVGGIVLARGVQTPYKIGDKIEIMVTLSDDTRVVAVDASHQIQVGVCNRLAETLAFPVGVDWVPTTAQASAPAPAAPPAAPAPSAPPSTTLPSSSPSLTLPSGPAANWSTGSIDAPIPGTHGN